MILNKLLSTTQLNVYQNIFLLIRFSLGLLKTSKKNSFELKH